MNIMYRHFPEHHGVLHPWRWEFRQGSVEVVSPFIKVHIRNQRRGALLIA
jgi:hypothetical protein